MTHPTIGYSRAMLPPGGTPSIFFGTALLAVFIEHIYYRSKVRPLFSCKRNRQLLVLRFFVSILIGSISALNAFSSLAAMRNTGVLHSKSTTMVVVHGCYEQCRNPLYSFLIGLYFSIAIGFNSRVFFSAALFSFLYIHLLVVPAEESFLAEHFGSSSKNISHLSRYCTWPTLC